MSLRLSKGYTILELCLVLGVMAVTAGIAIPYMSGMLREQRLGKFTNSCRDLAVTSRRHAIEEGGACIIRFQKTSMTLESRNSKKAILSISIPRDIEMRVRWSVGGSWQSPSGQMWIFQGNGLCEYLEIKTGIGASWSQIAFNPLTAIAKETASYYP